MQFNELQKRLWSHMIKLIEEFRKGKLAYHDLVGGLEGDLDAGEYKNDELTELWYEYWTPLEIAYATKGDKVKIAEVEAYLSEMELFLNRWKDL